MQRLFIVFVLLIAGCSGVWWQSKGAQTKQKPEIVFEAPDVHVYRFTYALTVCYVAVSNLPGYGGETPVSITCR